MAQAQRHLRLLQEVTIAAVCIFSDKKKYLKKTCFPCESGLTICFSAFWLKREMHSFCDRQEARFCVEQYSSPSHAQMYTYMEMVVGGKNYGGQQNPLPGNKRPWEIQSSKVNWKEGCIKQLQKQKQSPGKNHFWVAQPILVFTLQMQRTRKHGSAERLRQKKVNIPKVETILRSISSQRSIPVCIAKALPSSSQN